MVSKINFLASVSLCLAAHAIFGSQAYQQTIFLPGSKSITLSMGDITKKRGARGVKTAIVSAANKYMDYETAGGVAGAIGQVAGRQDLQEQARAQAVSYPEGSKKSRVGGIFCRPGQAVLTKTSELASKRFKMQGIDAIIHAVGPDCRIDQESQNRAALLKSVYGRIFDRAEAAGIRKLYIPGISIAIFACPIQEATPIALQVATSRLTTSRSLESVEFVLFDQATYDVYSAQLGKEQGAKEINLSLWQRFKRFLGF